MSIFVLACASCRMAKAIRVAPPSAPIILTDPRRNEERPKESPRTNGSSIIECPTAHSTPANQPVRVALRVEARNRGPGVKAPDELAITTVRRKSGVITARVLVSTCKVW